MHSIKIYLEVFKYRFYFTAERWLVSIYYLLLKKLGCNTNNDNFSFLVFVWDISFILNST